MQNARTGPRLAIGVDAARMAEMAAALPRLVGAGVDGAIVMERDASEGSDDIHWLERLRGVFDGGRVLLNGPVPAARRAGIGVLLPERGIATAEARRLLGFGLPVARQVSSPEAATAAVGADLIVIDHALADDVPVARRIVAAIETPALAWCVPTPEAARARFEAGCEGIVVGWETLDPNAPGETLAAVAAVVPNVPSVEREEAIPITLDGRPMTVAPETTIGDLLADAGLPEDTVARVNGVRLARRRYDETLLRAGDAVDTSERVSHQG